MRIRVRVGYVRYTKVIAYYLSETTGRFRGVLELVEQGVRIRPKMLNIAHWLKQHFG